MKNQTCTDKSSLADVTNIMSTTTAKSEETISKKCHGYWWKRTLTFGLLLVLGGGMTLRHLEVPIAIGNNKQADLLEVLTVSVTYEALAIRVEGNGTVISKDTVNLSPKSTGRLANLYVQQGDRVEAGQIVARMEVGSLVAELQQRQAQLAQAEAEYSRILAGNREEDILQAEARLVSAQSQVDLATTRLDRNKYLARQGAISQNDLDSYVHDAQTAVANLNDLQQQLKAITKGSRPEEIASADANVAAAQAQIKIVETELAEANIRAPFSGYVSQTYASIGAIVTPTTSASATASATSSSILALSSGLEVEIDILEANIGQIEIGQSVEIVAEAFPNQIYQGRVLRIAPEAIIENNITTFQVVVELVTGAERLRSGMTVDATFVSETPVDALMVPTVAIATKNGQLGVHLLGNEGNVDFQPVTVGITQQGKTQILQGLEVGNQIFLELPPK